MVVKLLLEGKVVWGIIVYYDYFLIVLLKL